MRSSRVVPVVLSVLLLCALAIPALSFSSPGTPLSAHLVHRRGPVASSRSTTPPLPRDSQSSPSPPNTIPVGQGPTALAFDPVNGELYVADVLSNEISVIYTSNDTVNTTIPIVDGNLTADPSNYIGSSYVAFDPANGEIYVSDTGSENVTVINGSTNTVAATINIGANATAIAVNSTTDTVFVASEGTGQVAEINGTTNTVFLTINTCSSFDLAYDPAQNLLFEACQSTTYLSVYDPWGPLVTQIATQVYGNGLAYDSSTGDVYILGDFDTFGDSNITVINASTLSVVKVIPTVLGAVYSVWCEGIVVEGGAYPQILALFDGTGSLPYYLVSINPETETYTSAVVLNNQSLGLAVDPQTGIAYITNPFNEVQAFVTPALLEPVVSIAPNHSEVDANETVLFNTSALGPGPFSYSYTVSDPSARCDGSTSATLTCTPTQVGLIFNVTVSAVDFYHVASSAVSFNVSVIGSMTVHLSVSNATPLLGQTIAFVTNASGGAAPYSYDYTGLPPGCVSQDHAAVGCLPTEADYYNITVSVTDQNGGVASANVTLHVIFDFNVIVPSNTTAGKPFTISVNTNESFSAGTAVTPASGVGPYTYNYTGLPAGCASTDAPSLTCTPTQVGAYAITVTVHDAIGDHRTHTVLVNVVPSSASQSGPLSGFSGPLGYAILGGVAAVLVVVGTLLALRFRQKGKTSGGGSAGPEGRDPHP